MNDLEDKLIDCFSAVFPKRSRDEIRIADRDSMEEWDSLTGIMLVAVVQQELKVEIDVMDLGQLGSFRSMLLYVSERLQTDGH